ncbi:MAG: hypothetical protein R8K20_02265, partial [Gallionellaceae bacterium]
MDIYINLRRIIDRLKIYNKERACNSLTFVIGLLTYAGLMIASPAISYAVDVTELRQVPSTLSDAIKSNLQARRTEFSNQLSLLNLKFNTFDNSN